MNKYTLNSWNIEPVADLIMLLKNINTFLKGYMKSIQKFIYSKQGYYKSLTIF